MTSFRNDGRCDGFAAQHAVTIDAIAGGVPVGQRYETGGQMHWYSGFEGAITVEFCTVPNAADMDGISENNEAEICTCRADNNLQQYEDDTGTNCTTGAVTF